MAFPYPNNREYTTPSRPAPRRTPIARPLTTEMATTLIDPSVEEEPTRGYLPDHSITNNDTLEDYVLTTNERRRPELERLLTQRPTYQLFEEYELLLLANEYYNVGSVLSGEPSFEEELADFLDQVDYPASRASGVIGESRASQRPAPASAATGRSGSVSTSNGSSLGGSDYLQSPWLLLIEQVLTTLENHDTRAMRELEQKSDDAFDLLSTQLRNNPDAFRLLDAFARLRVHSRLSASSEVAQLMDEQTEELYQLFLELEKIWKGRALLSQLDGAGASTRDALLRQLETYKGDKLVGAELARISRSAPRASPVTTGVRRGIRRIGAARR